MTKLKLPVSNLKPPTRNKFEVTAKWKVPAKAKKSGAADDVRFDGQDMLWVFDASPANKGHKKHKGDVVERDATNKDSQKTDTEDFNRKLFHPYAGKPVLKYAEFWVRGYNIQGTGNNAKRHYGPWAHKALAFEKPDPPTCSLAYDEEHGNITPSYNSKGHPAKGAKEVHDTQVWVTTGGSKRIDGKAYTDTSKTLSAISVTGAKSLAIGKYIKCVMTAVNRGLGGDSKKATATYYICHPNAPTCGTPKMVYADAAHTLATSSIVVPITNVGLVYDGDEKIRPTTVKLQYLKNSATSTDATSAASSDGWTDAASDDGKTNGLTATYNATVSDAGKYTWFRAVAIRDDYTVNGVPVRATCLDVLSSTAVVGAADISLAPGADGTSAVATLSGKGADDAGYEVSWSTAKDAWESTDPPDTHETTGSSLIIKKLDEGERVYAKARAYALDSDGNYVYGDYSKLVSTIPVSTPSTVVLHGAESTARGDDLLLTWTYDTEAAQQAWRLVDSSGNVVFEGTGATCAKVVTADDYGSASSMTLRVEMTTGGGWAKSGTATFAIADPPTCTLTAFATLTAQPVSFTVESDTGDTVTAVVSALGSTGSGLYGDPVQNAGDTVWSGTVAPEWTVSDDHRTATVTLPTGLTLWDDADYLLEVVTTDAATGLASAKAAAEFSVAWSHQAMQPTVTVTPDATAIAATIAVAAPSNVAIGDVFDLYRLTMDGERRIAERQPFGTSIVDRFAPFSHDGSNLAYMAVTRTADGDVCIGEDVAYTLVGKSLRLDWGTQAIELPYNLGLPDDFSKDSETRKHMDGTRQAYWNAGVTRKSSMTTDLIRFEDAAQQEQLRDALQYAGSVFVRTPDGLAFASDLNAGTIARSYDSAITGISLEAVEHDLTAADKPGDADITQPEWGGGSLTAMDGTVYDAAGKFPLYTWQFIGYSGTTLYVYDPSAKVRNGSGTEQSGWTYDGETLKNANDVVVPVTDEPEE